MVTDAVRIPRVELRRYGVQGTATGYEHIEINTTGMNGDEQAERQNVGDCNKAHCDQVLGANSEDDQPLCREMVAVLLLLLLFGTKPRTLHPHTRGSPPHGDSGS